MPGQDTIAINIYDHKGKVHRWRLCPLGKHYVREHQVHIPPSKIHPKGENIIRHAHCASNPRGKNNKEIKDILLFDELQIIANSYFSRLKGAPKANVLEYPRADAINHKNPPTIGPARGLMQITDYTLKILHGHKVELRDHFIYLSHATVKDPSANICAGTRWLFQKMVGAKARYAKVDPSHIVTWDDAVAEYKGVLSGILNEDNDNPDPENKMPIFRSIYKKFQE